MGWSESLPTGRAHGTERVLVCETSYDLEVIDVRTFSAWEEVASAVCGDPETTSYTMARSFRECGLNGWVGDKEIMLSNPATSLKSVNVLTLDMDQISPSIT